MKKLIFAVIPLALQLTCYADSIDSVVQDRISNVITVAGSYDKKDIYKPKFSLKISDEDGNITALTQENSAAEPGKFSFCVEMEAKSGQYNVTVNSNVFDSEQTAVFTYYNPQESLAALEEINAIDDTDKFCRAIEEKMEILGLDGTLTENLKRKNTVFSNIKKSKPFENISELSECFVKEAIKENFYEKTDGAYKLVDKYAKQLGTAEKDTYTLYEKFDEKEKAVFGDKMTSVITAGEDDFSKAFNEACILCEVYTANSYGDVGDAIKKYKKYTYSDEIKDYFSRSNTASIDIKLLGKSFSTIPELQKAIKDNLNPSSQGTGGNKGSGGSTGGSGGGAPIAQNPVKDIEKDDKSNAGDKAEYTDLDGVEWAKDAIVKLTELGIVNGRGDGIFDPDTLVKREEFVKMMVLACEIATDDNAKCEFSDVADGTWFTPYISAGVATGAINGLGDGSFGVGKTITRQNMATLVYKFGLYKKTEFPTGTDIGKFTDRAAISEYAKEAVSKLNACGIVNGMGDLSFAPKSGATRAQAAVIVYRMIEYMKGASL